MSFPRKLRVGDTVEVRSAEEILATLDTQGRLEGMPFMPEMLQFCGRRFRVFKRAHKTCDTVNRTGGRRVRSAVHLQELRCDGQAHGGCDAGCLLFWRQEWLRPVGAVVSRPHPTRPEPGTPSHVGCTREQLSGAACRIGAPTETDTVYTCQATALPEYTQLLKWWDLRQYVEDWSSGNVGMKALLIGAIYSVCYHASERIRGLGRLLPWVYDHVQALWGGTPYPRRRGRVPASAKTPVQRLELQPGEWVRVKSYAEILVTLDASNRNRGMLFDAEEVPFCGGSHQVLRRVNRIIDERSGKMIEFKPGTVILDGVYCQARYSPKRLHCPRAIYSFWRETWLDRVDLPPAREPLE
jgi:hypothetical protein